jgi:putative acetyltransferase
MKRNFKYEIRLARDNDFAAIARLHRQTIRHINSKDYPKKMIDVWSKRTRAHRFRRNASKCKRWVAVKNDKVVGFCDHNFSCELWGLYVHKDYLKQGIGSRLLKTAEKSILKSGCKKITIKASITAEDFYKKYGYKFVKKSFHQMGSIKLPIIIMNKKIFGFPPARK